MGGETAAGFLGILTFLVILLVIVWILLPFAVFGIKPRIDETKTRLDLILAALEKQTQSTENLIRELERSRGE